MRIAAVVGLIALVCVAAGWSDGGGAPAKPFLWQCEQIHLDVAKDACYSRLLLQDIDKSGNPATELPRIDRRARAAGTALYGRCHLLMHAIGREWAAEHHLTIEQLQNVEPRSNDPGCSAGFGMGLVMYLGPKIIATGGKSALPSCVHLPTQYRRYTCVHSLGHALMRGYHEALFLAVNACTQARPALRRRLCARGVPRLLDRVARSRRHDVADAGRPLAARAVQVVSALRRRLLVPLLHRACAGADHLDGRGHRAHVPRPRRRPARRLRRRRIARDRRRDLRADAAAARGCPHATRCRACTAWRCRARSSSRRSSGASSASAARSPGARGAAAPAGSG